VKPKSTIDPRMQTDPVEPTWERHPSVLRRVAAELRHHFWPVDVGRPWTSHAAAVAALAGTGAVLGLAIAGLVPHVSVLGAALLLSFWEARTRMASLRFVKEGPWWRHQYRVAKPIDMLSYVGFKNLLIGSVLFLVLEALGLLVL
jgi:NosR/NirI family nitrous oxide reductase transcriptional regulator